MRQYPTVSLSVSQPAFGIRPTVSHSMWLLPCIVYTIYALVLSPEYLFKKNEWNQVVDEDAWDASQVRIKK